MALAPGGRVTTGIRPVVETARYLSVHPLDEYSVIYLLDVPRLDRSAVAALEEFVDAGGGLGIFLGERTRSREINDQLYRDGEGLFPAPLAGPRELLVDRLTRAPDLNVADHPIFRLLAERSAGFLDMVRVERYFGLDPDWRPAPDSGVDVIARLRGGDPLMIEKRFGEGRVVAMLSTLGPEWNNWARNNPSFVVAMLEMQSYLAQQPGGRSPHRVGQPLAVRFEPDQYEPRVRLTPPAAITDSEDGSAPAMVVDAIPTPEGQLEVDITGTDRSGFYVAELFREDGTTEARPIAVNVEADEGDLVTLGAQQLASRLPGVDYQYEQADAFQYVMGDAPGFNLAELILYVLIALLIGEQLLAWWASYHPSSRPSPTARPAPVAGGGR
jgi:hypothetical protein